MPFVDSPSFLGGGLVNRLQVVLELDRSTQSMAVKLMAYLASRGSTPGLEQTPTIPVLMLLHDDVDTGQTLQHCQELGLAGMLS